MDLLIVAIFLVFPLGEIARIHLGEVSVGLIDLLMLPAIFLSLRVSYKEKSKLLYPIALTALAFLFSLLINLSQYSLDQSLVAILYLIRWISYSSIYIILLRFARKNKKNLYRYMFFSGALFLTLGFFQYFFYPSLKNLYYLGWDEHMYRLFSTFLDPNFTGIFMSLFLFFSFILRDKIAGKNKTLKFLVDTSIPFSALAVVLTYSRSALITLLTGFFVYCIIKRNVRLLAFILFSSILVFIILSKNFYIENTNLLRTASSKQRLETIVQSVEIYKKSPVFGIGFNALRYAREESGFKDKSLFGPSHSGAGVDNSFVFVLVTSGIVGLAAYLYLLYSIFLLAVKKLSEPEGVLLLVSLSGLVISSFFINSLFFSFLMIWVWALAAISERT